MTFTGTTQFNISAGGYLYKEEVYKYLTDAESLYV